MFFPCNIIVTGFLENIMHSIHINGIYIDIYIDVKN